MPHVEGHFTLAELDAIALRRPILNPQNQPLMDPLKRFRAIQSQAGTRSIALPRRPITER